LALGCGGDGGSDDTGTDAGPEDAGPLPSKCSTIEGPHAVSTAGDIWADGDGDAVWPSITAAGGRIVVAWHTEPDREVDPAATEHAFVAELDASGARLGYPVDVSPGVGSKAPSLAASGSNVAIAWREVGTGLTKVQVAIVGAGPALTAGAALDNAEPQTAPSLVGASGGDGFGVAMTVDPSDLAFVRLDANGMTDAADPTAAIVESTILAKPTAVALPSGFAIFYAQSTGLFAAFLDDAGALVSADPLVVAENSFAPCRDEGGTYYCEELLSSFPAVLGGDTIYAFNDNGKILTAADHGIYGHGFGADGTFRFASSEVGVAKKPARNPAAAWTGDGIALLWTDGRLPDSELHAALLDAQGEAVGGDETIAMQRGDEEMAAVAWLGTEGIVAYATGETPQRMIRVQRFTCAP
jgi:hypothetical protein